MRDLEVRLAGTGGVSWALSCFVIVMGGYSSLHLIHSCVGQIFQWYKMVHSSYMEGYHLRFGEYHMEQWFLNGEMEHYPYTCVFGVQKTKRMLFLYINCEGNTKTLLPLPASSFADDREMESCAEFLRDRKSDGPVPECDRGVTDQETGALFTFSFVQREADWLEEMTKGMHFAVHTRYGFRMADFLTNILMLIFINFVMRSMGVFSPLFPEWLVSGAIFIGGTGWFFWENYSRTGIRNKVNRLVYEGNCSRSQARCRTIYMTNYRIRVYGDRERRMWAYENIFVVTVGAKEIYIFFKDASFLCIPIAAVAFTAGLWDNGSVYGASHDGYR